MSGVRDNGKENGNFRDYGGYTLNPLNITY